VIDTLDQVAGWLSPALVVQLQEVGTASVLTLRGSLTGSSVAALEAQIDQLGSTSCADVVVDLSDLSDIDAVGAGLLFGLQHYVRGRGGRMTMIGARGAVAAAVAADPL